jgi:hypothetical protein
VVEVVKLGNVNKRTVSEQQINSFCKINEENSNEIFGNIAVDALTAKIKEGHVYYFNTRNTGLTAGSKMNLYIKNPAGSGKSICVIFQMASEASLEFKSYQGISNIVDGQSVEEISLRIPKLRDSSIECTSGITSFAYVESRFDNPVPLGSGGTAQGGNFTSIRTVIEEGYDLLVEITNTTNTTNDTNLSAEVIEI